MTVQDLIDELNNVPRDWPVYIRLDDVPGYLEFVKLGRPSATTDIAAILCGTEDYET